MAPATPATNAVSFTAPPNSAACGFAGADTAGADTTGADTARADTAKANDGQSRSDDRRNRSRRPPPARPPGIGDDATSSGSGDLAGRPGRANVRCRFFNRPGGCRAGNGCPYAHLAQPAARNSRTLPDATSAKAQGRHDAPALDSVEPSERIPSISQPVTAKGPQMQLEKTARRPGARHPSSTQYQNNLTRPRFEADRPGTHRGEDSPRRLERHTQPPIPETESRSHKAATPPIAKERATTSVATTVIRPREPVPRRPVFRPRAQERGNPEEAREAELRQLERRFRMSYNVEETRPDGATVITFNFCPSDPDFVFDLENDKVGCRLAVPGLYPRAALELEVLNPEIPRGLARNVEIAFNNQSRMIANLDSSDPTKTGILGQVNWLDRNLERLLSAPPGSTVTFVRREPLPQPPSAPASVQCTPATPAASSSKAAHRVETSAASEAGVMSNSQPTTVPSRYKSSSNAPEASVLSNPQPTAVPFRYKSSSTVRARDLGQLERRYNDSLKSVFENAEMTTICMSLVLSDPAACQGLKELQIELMIPVAYPEKAPSIRVLSLPDSIPAPDDARALIEMTFPTYIHLGTSGVRPSLQFMLNRLDHDLPLFLLGKGSPVSVQQPLRQRCFPQRTPPLIENEARPTAQTCAKPKRGGTSELFPADDRPWLIFGVENEGLAPSAGENATLSEELGRERAGGSCTAQGGIGIRNDASSEVVNGGVGFTDGDSELDGDGEQEPTATAESVSAAPLPPAGVDVRIPDVVLCRIATIECTSISVCLRCERCKKLNEIKALAPINTTGHGISHIFCSTCGIEGSIGFYRELLHPSNLKIGRLVVRGMVPTDLHPSSYVTTCESCAAPSPSPHRSVAVGQLLAANCRSCHAQNSFQIQAVQFIRVGGLDIDAGSTPRAETMRRKVRKAKEPGLVIGQCLPDTGTCRHYRKSHRWMRFTCCGKLYACDVCHAEAEGHEYEHPCTRMVCGYCSREQPFSDRPCVCGKYTKEKPSTSGFWEGGRGTRDRRQMNRNDPRKFAGLNKTVSTKGTSQQKRSETD